MKKSIAVLLLWSSTALGANQVFEVDWDRLPKGLDREVVERECTTTITVDEKKDLADAILSQAFRSADHRQEIEHTEGGVMGGGLPPEYTGDYLTRVYLVRQPAGSAYPAGVWSAVNITQYGKGSERKSFEMMITRLNYLGSAELAELSVCENLKYKKK